MDYEEITSDFARRTKTLIEEYHGQYKVTLLVNCYLGLLVLPKEKRFKEIPDDVIPEHGELWGLSRKELKVKCNECGYILRDVIRRIRNGICHFNIRSIPNEDGRIKFLEIKDRGGFAAKLSVAQLEDLAFSLVDHVYKQER